MEAQVLIVEDDPELREALRELLLDQGYEPAEAANGLQAIEYLREGRRPQVIVLDLSMPVVNGWEFRIAQQANPSFSQIPVVVLTAQDDTPAELAWMKAVALLKKPVDVDRFLQALRTALA